MSVSRLYIGNDVDISIAPFVDASTGIAITDAELFATICDASVTGSVTNASNAAPIVITSDAPHTLQTGDVVAVFGVGGNTAARGTWTITRISDTAFSLDDSAGNDAYTTGGRWYLAIDDPASQKIPFALDGARYLAIVPGSIGLIENVRYAIVYYDVGLYRDHVSAVDYVMAVVRGGNSN